MSEVVIVNAVRTPMGAFQGRLRNISAPELGAVAINSVIQSAVNQSIDEVIMGCVLSAGQGQAPARQAALGAGLSNDVPATTINKMCGSGMKAVMTAADQITAGNSNAIVAGGMESMSNAPYLLPKFRRGARFGHQQVLDHMFLDGLEDAYDEGRLMGSFAEDCAEQYQFTREHQDNFAIESLSRAIAATNEGLFANEIVAVGTTDGEPTEAIKDDEQLASAKPEKIRTLKPAFREGGTVTAANSSSISDGAAVLLLANHRFAEVNELPTRAIVRGYCSHAQAPNFFTTAPIGAANKLLDQLGWAKESVDLWEVNEAFAVVPMAFTRDMNLNSEVVNVNGGACALGHPIGASGARIIVTLLHALEQGEGTRGIAAVCIGGGEATAIAIERT
ncbi:MAG: acetyl-CoA C-acyltransferase [Aestuariivita sp.]|nr:acetyl-CoA C-acyltransferase [Aestuariivita sp.]MCY4346182.1 acetyl-CoA C-acyltransferase [Aestuariivita sp.]